MFEVSHGIRRLFKGTNVDIRVVLVFYRYTSLFITSVFYFVGPPDSPMPLKFGLCLCLLIEIVVFLRIYYREQTGMKTKKLLILIETLGLSGILIITGGMDSPFFWYAINPILLSTTILPIYFCWTMLAAFLFSAFYLNNLVPVHVEGDTLLWSRHLVYILIFISITLISQLYNYLISILSRQTTRLKSYIEHINSLYKSIEVFSHHNDAQEIVNLFAAYVKTLTDSDKSIVLVEMKKNHASLLKHNYLAVRGSKNILSDEKWYPYIKNMMKVKQRGQRITSINLTEEKDGVSGTMLIARIESKSSVYGIISAFYRGDRNLSEHVEDTINFLANLCGEALEKYSLTSIAEEFRLVEEKDRIASEIHDTVSQNLFGLIYGLDMIIRREPPDSYGYRQLKLLQRTAQRSIKDLREAIYALSTLKRNMEPFVDEAKKYFDNLEQMNNIKVEFYYEKDITHLGTQVRRYMYRIIREATGNAIRHGECNNIKVFLLQDDTCIKLIIEDDGTGFDLAACEIHRKGGLGIVNMKELARNMGGNLLIESSPDKGTKVICKIPTRGSINTKIHGEESVI